MLFRFSFSLTLFLLFVTVNPCSVSGISARSDQGGVPFFADAAEKWVDSVFNSLTPDERIGQLIMVAAYSDSRYARVGEIERVVKEYNIGGLVFMSGGPRSQATLTNRYQSLAKTPLMIAMDAEWGLGMRLDSTFSYPQHLILGAVQDDRLIYEMAADIARQMRRIGAHINFAPVLDININPMNPVIGSRSFGQDKWNVTEKGIHYMQGMQDHGVLAVGKHFPGHGDTDKDSHFSLPVITHGRERFDSLELVPFRELINKGVGGIMTAHLHVPDIDSTTGLASSLSSKVVEGLLNTELRFRGLVFTDNLNMRGVSDYFPPGQLEVQALLAGNDILLMPPDVDRAVLAIKKAVDDNIITREMIDERCRKILMAKYWLGLNKFKPVRISGIDSDLNKQESENLKRNITEASITLLENKNNIIPLRNLDTLNIATVSIGDGKQSAFQETLELYTSVTHFNYSKYSTLEQFNQLINELDNFNLVIVGILDADSRRRRQYGVSPQTSYFIRRLKNRNNVVLSLFTSPYGLEFFDDLSGVRALVLSYDDNKAAQEYSAQLIFGGVGARGRLPVTVSPRFVAGQRHKTDGGFRLSYSVAEKAGLDSEKLKDIDAIVENAINERATPGAQVLVARRGKVVYHKAFGYHTYRNTDPVKTSDLYDLASITKIASSVPALMKLIDEGKLDLGRSLGDYLPELEGTNKTGLIIKDVLTHQAGLQPWIPFYYDTFESLIPGEELFSRRVSARYPYMLGGNMFMNKNYRFLDSLFNEYPEHDFNIRVANKMYMNRFYLDSLYLRIDHSPLRPNNRYLYSDLGYYYLKNIIRNISSQPLEEYVYRNFYKPLGAGRMTYLPLEKYDIGEIIPTENDNVFRRQIVHGHVHDAGTAMIGGVGGHAGLFSNANDLAKFMQLLLQKGEYGGRTFFKPETIKMFTSAPNFHNGNRRGIGFDKPERNFSRNGPTARSASPESYGHTGFTGTMAWVDPKEEIVYIFLSNRVHPDQYNNKLQQMNVRTKIQQVIYDAIID